jgi:hypothetical protein
MIFHEAPPATDAIGSPRKWNLQAGISLFLFIVVLAGFVGILTHTVDPSGLFALVRDFIVSVAGLFGAAAGK